MEKHRLMAIENKKALHEMQGFLIVQVTDRIQVRHDLK